MLFRKNIAPKCLYCALGQELDDETVRCKKHGVVLKLSYCNYFRYDPLKRIPPRPAELKTDYKDEDFQI